MSTIIVGYFALIAFLLISRIGYNEDYSIAYIAAAYVVGYVINAISGLLESIWYWTIGGMPSDVLLTPIEGKKYTGIRRVRFYHAEEAIEKLRKQLEDPTADTRKMFSLAMRETNSNADSRVPDFNANYAFSRVLLTTLFIVTIIVIAYYPCEWKSYLLIIPLLLSWIRFKERGYYYAREVLNEYLNKH
ncbi:MAG: hypothetical protein KBT67_00865 [bacterium]|nr:hypothetical protein [Candidatus Limimorpha caballi]